MRPIEPINRLIQTQSKLLQYTIHTKKKQRNSWQGMVFFLVELWACRGCSSHTILAGLLYSWGDKSEKVCTSYKVQPTKGCTGYKVQPTKGLNLLKESECRASVQIVLCNSFLYTNNIQKYYSISRCVISIIIVIAPTNSIVKFCLKLMYIVFYIFKKRKF